MQLIAVGDEVRFRSGSATAEDWDLPQDAIGRVTRCERVPKNPRRLWVDVDFGPETGFVATVDATEVELVRSLGHPRP